MTPFEALVLTIVIENVAGIILMPIWKKHTTFRKEIFYNTIVNAATNSTLNLILIFSDRNEMAFVLFLEALIVIIEAYLFKELMKLTGKYSLLFSIALNVASFATGELIKHFNLL